jgi:hypothetical protein
MDRRIGLQTHEFILATDYFNLRTAMGRQLHFGSIS